MKSWQPVTKFFTKKRHAQNHQEPSAAAGARCVVSSLDKNEEWAKETFGDCQDVKIQKMGFHEGQDVSALLVYCEGLSDTKLINETIIPSLRKCLDEIRLQPLNEDVLISGWPISTLKREEMLDNLVTKVFNGQLILFFEGLASAHMIDIANSPARKPEDANTDVSIRGPRDGFVEDLTVNVALVRKRLRTNSLSYEQYILGERSQTKAGLLYIKDVIRPEVVEEVKNRLSEIDIDAVYSSSELEELLAESKFTLFPLFDYTGRPDFVVSTLLRGRFAIILDGVPTAIIAPANLTLIFKSAEDVHNSYSLVAFGRLLRLLGLCIALFLPGFYVGIGMYHQDQIPLTLLATLVMSRKGVPLPGPLEALLMLLMFELFREAGARLPSAIGQTLTVVGGLIIGDAAIRAGFTSPMLLVVIATSAVATFTLVNQSLIGAVSILRIGILIVSSFLGIFGFLLSVFVVLISLANLRSFGIPYLAPISPLILRDLVQALFRVPATYLKKRPKMLNTQDSTRKRSGK
ncbi:spore germination protein [Paenibacillus mendelii]|uniref:Spore germination protein n=1 Tax=Paenibacillus mendelii TaxID=206163 RepID=A0ABV6JES6_9BACL|nr:spore germination protein [Paenibacillus mendelii]MCQ6557286.1 spore germination protein [Paenibacillus mendelii]